MCTIWRDSAVDEYNVLLPDDIPITIYGEGEEIDQPNQLSNLPRHKVHRQRLVLSLALITQASYLLRFTKLN